MPIEPIRIDLEDFCSQFTAALEPFESALLNGTRNLRQALDRASIQPVLSNLQDNQHRLKILLDKARQQNTYLVIFGPLKSGKSTLMNAISGAYVSEVTSLPAYPCLVYVRQGESRGFSTTAFNGDSTEYTSREQLQATLEKAHEELAKRIREVDQSDQPFNPVTDFDRAIRRIDFTTPAPYLRESGTILVDTPGLYTKMRYDYGRLTRDFRNTAACAVFVVKTDNLFFEQVFEEFTDLLKVFSRVFLVVNIDSTKQDLGPDGKLRPSLEQHDPGRIVEAFESLTVSSEIRSAIDEGRLRIYTIDLLQTAAGSLQGSSEATATTPVAVDAPDEPDQKEKSDATPELSFEENADAARPPSTSGSKLGFDAFLGDLTEYLNSSEYIIEFMADSFRQADSIVTEVKSKLAGPETVEFREKVENLKGRVEHAERQLADANSLRDHKWRESLDKLGKDISQRVTEHTGSVLPELNTRLHKEVRQWIETDESVSDLVTRRVKPKIQEACEVSRKRAVELVDGVCTSRNDGLQLSPEVAGRIHGLGLSFNDLYAEFQPTVHKRLHADLKMPDDTGMQEALPLRKRFVDWLIFRTKARLRMRIFGENNPSEMPIPAVVKAKRIDDAGIQLLCDAIDGYCRKTFDDALVSELTRVSSEYTEFFHKHVRERLDTKVAALEKDHKELNRQHEVQNNVIESLNELVIASDTLNGEVTDLRGEFVADKLLIHLDEQKPVEDGPVVEDGPEVENQVDDAPGVEDPDEDEPVVEELAKDDLDGENPETKAFFVGANEIGDTATEKPTS